MVINFILFFRFGLALKLHKLSDAKKIAYETNSQEKYKQLADLAMELGSFSLGEECLRKANDYQGLLLYYSCINNREKLAILAEESEQSGFNNVAYTSYFLINNLEKCYQILIKSKRFSEAALFCRTYYHNKVSEALDLWNKELNSDDQNSRIGKIFNFLLINKKSPKYY